MSLKDTINNTNTQKENIKTVANNIDNKLIELGGERATNLADVALKIQEMSKQYSKVAEIEMSKILKLGENDHYNKPYAENIIQLNINFIPKRIIAKIHIKDYKYNIRFIDSKFQNNKENGKNYSYVDIRAYITISKNNEFIIYAQHSYEYSDFILDYLLILG